ncbi:hypothetical protein DAI22_01g029300 [Oryza sativa Japonica Group]|nr:hypothetical protein DAI22_01g029300 [Oryza sativa Japonica Group]
MYCTYRFSHRLYIYRLEARHRVVPYMEINITCRVSDRGGPSLVACCGGRHSCPLTPIPPYTSVFYNW